MNLPWLFVCAVSQLNHFPGTFQIGRKDRLWRNLSKMQVRFGKQEFSFFPRTFILPQDIKLLRKAWEDSGSRQKWIIKPVCYTMLLINKLGLKTSYIILFSLFISDSSVILNHSLDRKQINDFL